CRCTGYGRIVEAVLDAASPPAGPDPAGRLGEPLQHVDGPQKVTGETRFGADAWPRGVLLARIVRSPHAHARFRLGDTAAFLRRHPGIVAVYDASHVPGENRHGVIPRFEDQPVFAEGEVRFRGEAVAMIVGEADAVGRIDPEELPVEWEVFEPLAEPEAALAPSAAPLHA